MNEYKKPKSLEQAKVMKAYIEKYIITLTEYKESKNFDSVFFLYYLSNLLLISIFS